MVVKKIVVTSKIPRKMIMTSVVYEQICNTIGRNHPETGGMLGSSDGGRTIDYYYFDDTAKTTGSTYSPDTEKLNLVIEQWNRESIELVGFIHSHPGDNRAPSSGDCLYVKKIMEAMDVHNRLFMLIANVRAIPDGKTEIYPYIFVDSKRFGLCMRPIAQEIKEEKTSEAQELTHLDKTCEDRFDRIVQLYPLNVIRGKTVVCIGLGGSRQFVEELARTGVGNFVLIDGDDVSATNIATQQVYDSEIGRNKAEILRERILQINPAAKVKAIPRFMSSVMTDKEVENIIGPDLLENPTDILLCGCTDNFHAQARTASLAMKYGTPYLAAQLYRGGMAAEIYFSYPGVTKSCPRCVLHSRYEAYQNGYKNDVTAVGVPIFATTRVNATKGQIALMLLLYQADKDCIYNNMLDQVSDRNFVMINMNPLAGSALGIGVFDEAVCTKSGLNFFDNTVWVPQAPNDGTNGCPVCPLCGGAGDLQALKGKIRDTLTDC